MLEFDLDSGNLRKLRIVKVIRKIGLDEILSVFEDNLLDVYPAKDDRFHRRKDLWQLE